MSGGWDPFGDLPSWEQEEALSGQGQTRSRSQAEVEVGEVEVKSKTERAILCVQGEKRRWVPLSQVVAAPEQGETGPLVVTEWFSRKWAEDEPEAREQEVPVEVEGVVCLQEARSGKAILCRVGTEGEEFWIPVSQIVEGSEVRHDGDLGVLRISRWIAQQKGLAK